MLTPCPLGNEAVIPLLLRARRGREKTPQSQRRQRQPAVPPPRHSRAAATRPTAYAGGASAELVGPLGVMTRRGAMSRRGAG